MIHRQLSGRFVFSIFLSAVGSGFAVAASAAGQITYLGGLVELAGPEVLPAAPALVRSFDNTGFLAAWEERSSGASGIDVFVRRFDRLGTPIGPAHRVNQTLAGDQVTPAMLDNVVVWASQDGPASDFDILGRLIDRDGVPVGDEFVVNETLQGDQRQPRVARWSPISLFYGFVVVWSGSGPGDDSGIFGRTFWDDGTAFFPEFRVNQTVVGTQVEPALAVAAGENTYFAAWASEGLGGGDLDIVGRRFGPDGEAITGEFDIHEPRVADQSRPDVLPDGYGPDGPRFLVAWQDEQMGLPTGIGLRRILGSGAPDGDATYHAPQPCNILCAQPEYLRPRLIELDEERVVAVFESDDPFIGDASVFGLRLHREGSADSELFALGALDVNVRQSAPIAIPSGLDEPLGFTAAWVEESGVTEDSRLLAQRYAIPTSRCVEDGRTLCLQEERFLVRASFNSGDLLGGLFGEAQANALTDDAGTFWFFDPEAVEILVKVVDACGLVEFQNFWVFTTGLTNVEVGMTVIDTWTSERVALENPLYLPYPPTFVVDRFLRVCDASFSGFPPGASRTAAPSEVLPAHPERTVAGSCVPDGHRLCLLDGRFEVTLDWTAGEGEPGLVAGNAVALSDQSGTFWFFDEENVEVLVKMIDGCSFNERYWLFAAGLTNLETTLRIRDTVAGATRVSVQPAGTPFPPVQTIDAFGECP